MIMALGQSMDLQRKEMIGIYNVKYNERFSGSMDLKGKCIWDEVWICKKKNDESFSQSMDF